ncbi:MAG TPA: cupin domain-containing protein [Solirubrobacteraceae bacterium]|nr:cupin domain-containing protein [Solirubrobacteraceae bacterium]
MDDGIARSALRDSAPDRFVALRRELGVTTFGINQILLEPGQRSRIHRHHRQEEVYLVLNGTLTVCVEGEPHELSVGELMRVAPSVRRQLVNRGPGTVSVLALGGANEHAGRDGEAFSSWEQTTGAAPQDIPLPEDLPAAERRGAPD